MLSLIYNKKKADIFPKEFAAEIQNALVNSVEGTVRRINYLPEVSMFGPCRFASIAVSLFSLSVVASPKIEFDTKVFQCGTVVEGTEKLKATFTVKNTGDQDLKINAHPSCGCTVVKYDTLIHPGKQAKIESEVNIANYHGGQISKTITVSSNAQNEPQVGLSIKANIQAIIEVSENYLALNMKDIKTPQTLYLASKKSDLKVIEISYKNNESQQSQSFLSKIPLPIKFDWIPTDSTRSDSCRVFKLNIFAPSLNETTYGEFVIKTNHPKKPEINLRGIISNQN